MERTNLSGTAPPPADTATAGCRGGCHTWRKAWSAAPSPGQEGCLGACSQHRAPRRFLATLLTALQRPWGQGSHFSHFPHWHSLLWKKGGPHKAQRRCPRGRQVVISPQGAPSNILMASRHSFLCRGEFASFSKNCGKIHTI